MTDEELEDRREAMQARLDRAAARITGEAHPLGPPPRIRASLATGRIQISRGAFS